MTEMPKNTHWNTVVTATACAVVGVLAAMGKFNSISGFPVVFAGICLAIGVFSLWRERPRSGGGGRAVILVAGAAIALGGWAYQQRVVDQNREAARLGILTELEGTVVPALRGLDPLNTDQESWDRAASLTAPATLVTFWARWCSPCWKEMEELEELYREHAERGLSVIAVTRYDRPGDPAERESDLAKARKFLAKRDLTYPAAITDRDDIYSAYRVRSPPGLVLIDSEGRVLDFAISLESARGTMQRARNLVEVAGQSAWTSPRQAAIGKGPGR